LGNKERHSSVDDGGEGLESSSRPLTFSQIISQLAIFPNFPIPHLQATTIRGKKDAKMGEAPEGGIHRIIEFKY
jgi:hypothetical protein